ncbi:MAG: glycosyltransferase family 9 protein [Candidatus Binatia bacterium]|nr:glycosyltransferase family 9 protein [Candidatus Binatia bacterium]
MRPHDRHFGVASQSLGRHARVLLVRTDHLGDMLLTLPMAQVLRAAQPEWRVSVLASPANREAAEHHPDVSEVLVDIEAKHSGLRQLRALARDLAGRFDAAILVHPTPRLALALWLAHIPLRIGTAYRAYSFLLNRRVRQHRRGRAIHESLLNLELLSAVGIAPPQAVPPLRWQMRDHEVERVEALLRQHGLSGESWAVIHPGSAGSALNWDASAYAAFGQRIAKAGHRVVVTGTMREQALAARVCSGIGSAAVNLCGALSLGELAVALQRCSLFIGGSTGPTHLAALLGAPTVALYSPLRSQRPERWQPLGPRVLTLLPDVGQQCPRCLGARCPYFLCMTQRLSVDTVWQAAQQLLRASCS